MSGVIELRQYTLKPGRRDELIALFEREFIETQEVLGMDVIGIFRDETDADRFVWVRGFPDMDSRARSLQAFYTGPVWMAHREAANATMIDSDNVLLLRPAWEGAGFAPGGKCAPVGATRIPNTVVTANICPFAVPVPQAVIESMRRLLPKQTRALEGSLAAALVTEPSPNNFPRLPVREGENVFVWFTVFDGPPVAFDLPDAIASKLARPMETLRLCPTPRSRLGADAKGIL